MDIKVVTLGAPRCFDLFRGSPYEHAQTAAPELTRLVQGQISTFETNQPIHTHVTRILTQPRWLGEPRRVEPAKTLTPRAPKADESTAVRRLAGGFIGLDLLAAEAEVAEARGEKGLRS